MFMSANLLLLGRIAFERRGRRVNKRIDIDELLNRHPDWPTHTHKSDFWEVLGRTVASFGFLEELLARAIFAITGTKKVSSDESQEEEFRKWSEHLLKAMSDTLSGLIRKYKTALEENPSFSTKETNLLIKDLEGLKEWRNILCHCSWRSPNAEGNCIPLFMKRSGDILQNEIDIETIQQVRKKTVELTCEVMNSVTVHGYEFPGSGY